MHPTCAFPNSNPLTLDRKSGSVYHSGVSSFTSDSADVHMSQLRATLLNNRSATSKVPFCRNIRKKHTKRSGRHGGGGGGKKG